VTLNRRRTAAWLWILWAFVVWNLVFDLVIVEAGREYVRVARAAAAAGGAYAKIEDTMQPARSRALWLATASAGVILVVGLFGVRRAGLSGPPISTTRPRRT
jgi:4-amino-4-deoxy-L-arabinose transferase-like glycosyltransferase